jgi:hypothetical protein
MREKEALVTARSSRQSLWVFVAASALAAGSARAAELFSESVLVPPTTTYLTTTISTWPRFTMLLTSDPNLPTQDSTDKNTDPYAVNGTSTITTDGYSALSTDEGTPVGPGLVTKDGGIREVVFSGRLSINQLNVPNQHLDNPPNEVQFGLTGPPNNAVMHFIEQHWGGSYQVAVPGGSRNGRYLRGEPIVNVTPSIVAPATPPAGQSFNYIVNYLQFTEDGITGTEWVEFPYLPGKQPTFSYGGWADLLDPIHFTANYIQLSDTQIPIDSLNFADDPLTGGISGSAFTQLANPPDVVPEPAGVLGIFVVAILIVRSRRSHAAHDVEGLFDNEHPNLNYPRMHAGISLPAPRRPLLQSTFARTSGLNPICLGRTHHDRAIFQNDVCRRRSVFHVHLLYSRQ